MRNKLVSIIYHFNCATLGNFSNKKILIAIKPNCSNQQAFIYWFCWDKLEPGFRTTFLSFPPSWWSSDGDSVWSIDRTLLAHPIGRAVTLAEGQKGMDV